MNWSVQQRQLLKALGHELMVHGTAWPAPVTAPAAGPAPVPPRSTQSVRELQAPARSAAAPSTARLLEALRRAANGADVSALAGDLERLRREPALKRALWPRLRALRRSH